MVIWDEKHVLAYFKCRNLRRSGKWLILDFKPRFRYIRTKPRSLSCTPVKRYSNSLVHFFPNGSVQIILHKWRTIRQEGLNAGPFSTTVPILDQKRIRESPVYLFFIIDVCISMSTNFAKVGKPRAGDEKLWKIWECSRGLVDWEEEERENWIFFSFYVRIS